MSINLAYSLICSISLRLQKFVIQFTKYLGISIYDFETSTSSTRWGDITSLFYSNKTRGMNLNLFYSFVLVFFF